MSKSALIPKVILRTYAELRRGVEETLLTEKRRIEEAKVRTYWETGRLIQEHLLIHKIGRRRNFPEQLRCWKTVTRFSKRVIH